MPLSSSLLSTCGLCGPLTNTVLANRHFSSIEALEDAQAERCVALQRQRDLVRSTTCFRWWPQRIRKRQGPKTAS
jgi:hypothetical protein